MRRLGIFLDASTAMSNPAGEFKPNPLLYSIRLIESFVPEFLRRNTLGSICIYELRDGICQQIAPLLTGKWSSNPAQLIGDIQSRFQTRPAGSGVASIVNALRVISVELGSDTSPSLGFSGNSTSSALLVTSSLTLADVGDVYQAIDDVVRLGVSVDILSFSGAPHILEMVTHKTGGILMCPVTPMVSLQLLSNIAHPAWRQQHSQSSSSSTSSSQKKQKETQKERNILQRDRCEEDNNNNSNSENSQIIKMTPIALFHDTSSIPEQCPLCFAPQHFCGFPRTCPSCGLLSLSEVQWRTSRAEATAGKLIPVSLQNQKINTNNFNNNNNNCVGGLCGGRLAINQKFSSSSCETILEENLAEDEDDANRVEEFSTRNQNSINNKNGFVLRCISCLAPFCKNCALIYSETVHFCPSCGVMLEA